MNFMNQTDAQSPMDMDKRTFTLTGVSKKADENIANLRMIHKPCIVYQIIYYSPIMRI